MILAASVACLVVSVLVLGLARSLLQAAKELRREAASTVASIVAAEGIQRDKLLDRIALYDAKPAPAMYEAIEEVPDTEFEGLTANIESLLGDG